MLRCLAGRWHAEQGSQSTQGTCTSVRGEADAQGALNGRREIHLFALTHRQALLPQQMPATRQISLQTPSHPFIPSCQYLINTLPQSSVKPCGQGLVKQPGPRSLQRQGGGTSLAPPGLRGLLNSQLSRLAWATCPQTPHLPHLLDS